MATRYKTQLTNLVTTPENTPTLIKAIRLWDASAEIQSSLMSKGDLAGLFVTHVHSDEDSSYSVGDDEEMSEIYQDLMPSLAKVDLLATQMTLMWGNGEMNGWSVHFNQTGEVVNNSLDNMDTRKTVLLQHVRDHCQESLDDIQASLDGQPYDVESSTRCEVYEEIRNVIDAG